MKESWNKNFGGDWPGAAWQSLEDLGNQFKRNVEIRMRKGDVRAAVLRLLFESPMHGYQIIHEIETRSGGVWKPSPGSVYPTLQLLSDEGLIAAQESEGRRTYSLSEAGKEVAAAEMDSPAPWDTTIDRPSGPRSDLAVAGVKLAKAAADVARLGSTEQIEKATALLAETTATLAAMVKQN